MRYPLFLAPIALASVVFIASAHANLVANGGFEDGTSYIPGPGNSGGGGTAAGGGDNGLKEALSGIPSWDVGPVPNPNGVNVTATNNTLYYRTISEGGAPGGGPRTGEIAAVFPNTPEFNGYMSQAVTGVVGGWIYKIGFYASNQVGDFPTNSMTVKWGGNINAPGDPLSGGYILNTADPTYTGTAIGPGQSALPGAIVVPQDWKYYEWIVGAPSNDARLTFIGGNTAAGNLIDDVSVEFVAVPEISSFGMIVGLGLFALGTMVRVRRRSLVAC